MTTDETITRALNPQELRALPGARLVDVKWEHYRDWQGIPSLRVWVILDESITDEEIVHLSVAPLALAIHDRLIKAGVELFPYIRYGKQSDLDEAGVKI